MSTIPPPTGMFLSFFNYSRSGTEKPSMVPTSLGTNHSTFVKCTFCFFHYNKNNLSRFGTWCSHNANFITEALKYVRETNIPALMTTTFIYFISREQKPDNIGFDVRVSFVSSWLCVVAYLREVILVLTLTTSTMVRMR